MIKHENEVMNLYHQGIYSGSEIAKELGIGRNRVWDIFKKYGISKKTLDENKKFKIKSQFQEEVLIGTVLGDGCVFKQNQTAIKCRLTLSHSLKQKEYFLKKYEILKDLIDSDYRIGYQDDKRTNKNYDFIKFQSRPNLLYTDLKEKWYKNGKKIITDEIYKYGEVCLSVIYFDDGYKSTNGFYFALCDYDYNSISMFQNWIFDKFGIKSTLHKGNKLYIPKPMREKFINIVKPFATKDVLYKLGELLENPEVDNQQPSCGNPIEVPQKVQRLTGEDGNQ